MLHVSSARRREKASPSHVLGPSKMSRIVPFAAFAEGRDGVRSTQAVSVSGEGMYRPFEAHQRFPTAEIEVISRPFQVRVDLSLPSRGE